MQIRNTTETELIRALELTNKDFKGNIDFNRLDKAGKTTFTVTLRTKDSHKIGSKISYSGRHIPSACWHSHGVFFDALLSINSKVVIVALGEKIYKNSKGETIGNWVDRNIGSIMNPLSFSHACDCGMSNKKIFNAHIGSWHLTEKEIEDRDLCKKIFG
jgi:hypothetical protein